MPFRKLIPPFTLTGRKIARTLNHPDDDPFADWTGLDWTGLDLQMADLQKGDL